MSKMAESRKLIVTAGVTLVLSGGGGAGVWWAKGLVEEERTAIEGLRQQVEVAEGKIRKIPALERDVIILRENVQEYVKILPEEGELNAFVRTANQFIAQSGVVLRRFVPAKAGEKSKNDPFARYTYSVTIDATLWQALQFVSFFENYERFVMVRDFMLTSGAQREGAPGEDVRHNVTMTVETYVYTGSPKGKDVVIPNYLNKVERLREEIFEKRQMLAMERYEFQGARGRRDIFVDPRQSSLGTATGGLSVEDQKAILDRFRTKVQRLTAMLTRVQDKSITIFEEYSLRRTLKEELTKVTQEAEDINVKHYLTHKPLRFVWTREIVEPLTRLKVQVSEAPQQQDRFLPERDMKVLLADMKNDLTAGELDAAIERYDDIAERLRVPQNDPRYPLAVDIEGMYVRAKVALEFRALPLEVSGICVNDLGRSGLILNGAVFEEGDYIDGDLLVKEVLRDQIVFVYKGFTVVKTL